MRVDQIVQGKMGYPAIRLRIDMVLAPIVEGSAAWRSPRLRATYCMGQDTYVGKGRRIL